MRRFNRIICAILGALLVCCALSAPAQAMTVILEYPASDRELVNPYIGNAVWASSDPAREQPYTLIYADLTWADFEPEKGKYDFESFESRINLAAWRDAGKHIIFRFVLDKPGNQKHADIPAWLLEEIGEDGQYYSTDYGRGFCPNYENSTLIRAHKRAIEALGKRYGEDPMFAFVQLGSLGHWGEWHVHGRLDYTMPPMDVCEEYVEPYLSAFPNSHLMARRPFSYASEHSMGLYNDTAGNLEGTEEWLGWIQSGGSISWTEGGGEMVAMPSAWRSAPIGGELTTYQKTQDLLKDKYYEQTLSLFRRSHASWIGPGSFVDIERDGDLQARYDELIRMIGYRLRVEALAISDMPDDAIGLSLRWKNDGIAPFYFNWTPALRILSSTGAAMVFPLEMVLTDIQPDNSVTVQITLDKNELPQGECTISIGILNPASAEPGVSLAMDVPLDGFWHELTRIMVR